MRCSFCWLVLFVSILPFRAGWAQSAKPLAPTAHYNQVMALAVDEDSTVLSRVREHHIASIAKSSFRIWAHGDTTRAAAITDYEHLPDGALRVRTIILMRPPPQNARPKANTRDTVLSFMPAYVSTYDASNHPRISVNAQGDTAYWTEQSGDTLRRFGRRNGKMQLHDLWVTNAQHELHLSYLNGLSADRYATITDRSFDAAGRLRELATYTRHESDTASTVRNRTRYTYDTQGRLMQEMETSPTGDTALTRYSYGSNGRLREVTSYSESSRLVSHDTYSLTGRSDTLRYYGEDGAEEREVITSYDKAGRPERKMVTGLADGETHEEQRFEYNAHGDETHEVTLVGGHVVEDKRFRYTYVKQ